jgi:GH43 family beta-xylosidase
MLKYCHLGLLVCLLDLPLALRSEAQTQTNAPAETAIRSAVEAPRQFINPIAEGADPWVVRDAKGERYLWCLSEENRGISLWASSTLTSLGRRHLVWQAPESGPYSKEVWAPELHQLDGHWYIYFAASDGHNHNHLTYVLRSDTEDPLGRYTLHGPLATGDGADGLSPNLWAIDMTVLEHAGRRYAVWSGWDGPRTDRQFLYIAPMRSPTELAGPRVRICANDDYLWERTEERASSRGLHEGPQIIQRTGRTFVVYSCAASGTGRNQPTRSHCVAKTSATGISIQPEHLRRGSFQFCSVAGWFAMVACVPCETRYTTRLAATRVCAAV